MQSTKCTAGTVSFSDFTPAEANKQGKWSQDYWFFTGLWDGMINTAKLHKFFTNRAIERAKDAWWDMDARCVAMKADQEMTNILTYDMDLIFPETKVELEISGSSTLALTIAKIQDDLLLTGSISTFRSMATTATTLHGQRDEAMRTQKQSKLKQKQQTWRQSRALSPLSESNIQILITRLTQALNMQNNATTNTTKEPTSGQNTGSKK